MAIATVLTIAALLAPHEVVSTWHRGHKGQAEDLAGMSREDMEAILKTNHTQLRSADAIVALGYPGGCEMLVEVGVAMAWNIPVVWVDAAAKIPVSVRTRSAAVIGCSAHDDAVDGGRSFVAELGDVLNDLRREYEERLGRKGGAA